MQNYIEIGDKIVATDGNIQVLTNCQKSKELIEEENRLETINQEIGVLDGVFRKEVSKKEIKDVGNKTISFAISFIIIVMDIVFLYISKMNPSIRFNIDNFIKIHIAIGSLASTTLIVNIIDKYLYKKKERDYTKKRDLLSKIKTETEEKITILKYQLGEAEKITINKSNKKDILQSIKEELENSKGQEPIEKDKVKGLGTR